MFHGPLSLIILTLFNKPNKPLCKRNQQQYRYYSIVEIIVLRLDFKHKTEMKGLFKKALLIGMIGLGISGAKAQVSTHKDPTADFSDYRTFAWVRPDIQVKNPQYNNDLITKNIQANVDEILMKKGMSINTKQPDLLLRFHTDTEKQTTRGSFGPTYPMIGYARIGRMLVPYNMGYWGGGYSAPYTYTEGTLVIDAIDAKTNRLVWQGSISSALNARKIDKQIEKGVSKIMKRYPAS